MDFISASSFLILIIFVIVLFVLVIRLPIVIAKSRGVSDDELTAISILSWLGLICGVTWIIALVLSLIYQPSKWIDKDSLNLDKLEKLHSLMKKKVISKKEYEEERKKILKKK